MKINKTVLSIAIVYNVINFMFWQYIKTTTGASSMIFIFIFPVFWIISILVVTILAFKNKATWFQKGYKASTIVGILVCTPILFWFVIAIQTSESYCNSTGYTPQNGYTFKYESWIYRNGSRQVVKYWKADGENCDTCDSSHFKRDSTWVYFNKKKDTVKVEIYKNDKLISVRKKVR